MDPGQYPPTQTSDGAYPPAYPPPTQQQQYPPPGPAQYPPPGPEQYPPAAAYPAYPSEPQPQPPPYDPGTVVSYLSYKLVTMRQGFVELQCEL